MTLIEKIVFGDLPWINFIIGILSVFLCVFDIIELHYLINQKAFIREGLLIY